MPVAAAGNGGTNVPWYPCAYDYVVCAGASFNDGSRCTAPSCSDSGSNYGNHVDFAVPGYLLRGAGGLSTTDYASASATSFAAPLLAGVAAILHAAGKTTPLSKYEALYFTTQNNLGWTSRGLIDANAAVLY